MRIPKRDTTRRKYRAMRDRFKELYDGKRLRYDDCIAQLQKEFYMSQPESVMKALRIAAELPHEGQLEMEF